MFYRDNSENFSQDDIENESRHGHCCGGYYGGMPYMPMGGYPMMYGAQSQSMYGYPSQGMYGYAPQSPLMRDEEDTEGFEDDPRWNYHHPYHHMQHYMPYHPYYHHMPYHHHMHGWM